MAPAIKIPNPNKTGTPKGMEGVRPKALKAPKPPKPRPNRIPSAAGKGSSFYAAGAQVDKPSASGGTTAGLSYGQVTGTAPRTSAESTPPPPPAPAAPPATTTQTVTTPGTPPTAEWWRSAYTSDPSFLLTDPSLRASQNQTSSNYGYTINRDTTEGSPTRGQAYYRAPKIDPVTKKPVLDEAGKPVYLATSILQTFDDAGKPVYKDSTGKVYAPAELEMDINRVAKGEAGYLEGALGAAEATSERNQFNVGDVAARAGARRSGMRAQAGAAETAALQSALSGLTQKAAGELTGIDKQYADLYSAIFRTLLPKAEALAAPTTTTTEVPVAPEAPAPAAPAAPEYLGYNQAPTPPPGTLGAGPGGAFMTLVGDLTLERNTNDAAIRQGLRALLNNPAYQLSSQQIRYINSLITGRYKGNKKY